MKKSILIITLLFSGLIAWSQERVVSGTVTAATSGETLPGVSILIKGTTQGVTSDIDGSYKISVPSDGATLVYSFVGFLSEEVEVGNRSVIDMTLVEDIQQLDEIIVVGYGVQKKSVATASLAKVDGEKLKGFAAPQVEQMLQGQVAGVIFKSASGQPGSATNILIRGIGTNGNNSPLVILDGLVVSDGALNGLNPDDIENIQVMKDGASTAIYGARAANGIIMVTTKKAKAGEGKLNYAFNTGVQNVWRLPKMMNASEYTAAITNKYENSNLALPAGFEEAAASGVNTNWMDEIFETGRTQSHQLSYSKGTEKGSMFTSASYWNQSGLVAPEKSNLQRFTVRTNFDQKINNYLTVGQNLYINNTSRESIGENSEFGTAIADAIAYDPLTAVYDENAQFGFAQSPFVQKEYVNPLSRIFITNNDYYGTEITGNTFVKLTPFEGLSFRSDFGFVKGFNSGGGFSPQYNLTPAFFKARNDIFEYQNEYLRWQFENYATYEKQFGDHAVSVTAGTTAQKITASGFGASSSGIPAEKEFDPDFWVIDVTPDSLKRSSSYIGEPELLASIFGRVNYNYQEKYLASFTLRRDGSSKFGPANQYGIFPSASVGWVISRENFFNVDAITNLKVRASYGINGNDRIPNLQFASLIGITGAYQFGKPANQGVYIAQSSLFAANPSIRWEESRHLDIGVESSFFNNSLSVELDYFHKTTSGLLMTATVGNYLGNKPPISNVGEVVNKGFEFDINYQRSIGEVKLNVGFNGSTLVNNVTKVTDDGFIQGYTWPIRNTPITRMEVGQPIGFFRGYRTDGIFRSQDDIFAHINAEGDPLQPNAQPGDLKFVDANGDGLIDANDIVNIGKPWADLMLGLNLSATYKNFDARVLFAASIGNDVYRSFERQDVVNNNYLAVWNDRWTEENPDGEYPRLSVNDQNNNARASDFYVEDASFLRLRTMQIGYNAPAKWLEPLKMTNLRVYVSADNLLTITGYTGFDPEIGSSGWILDTGIDKGFYPQSRTFSFGLNVSF
ncbi:TonB-dependent receptor [Cytophagales bacterium LB-30]|uniref:TonB-dependent receptor n=1 Tax=Shiella aurantiaca TaxID=3058365 RepID=A0ABT8F8W6_9BACT|nr:TonB-dependent receptor [Shiella aurantiaca]MDN4166694.1 TonB-dependent receptor [Shiella aurantiaca]